MKNVMNAFMAVIFGMIMISCEKNNDKQDDISGDQSPMGDVGVTVSSSSSEIAGISNFAAMVTGLADGVSSYNASATITNPLFKNMVAGFPGVTINGDVVTITDMKMQQTKEGIKCITGPGAGVLVKYDSKVGDTYPIGNTGKVRKVVSKSTTDDYAYGFFLIKTIQVEDENMGFLKNSGGILKTTYISNHRFGLVGVRFDFDDGTSVTYPLYTSAEN